MRRRVAASAKPNPAHFALAKLEQALEERLFLCTQNVDDLHEQAGSRARHPHARRTFQEPLRQVQPTAPSRTQIPTILHASFPGANAAAGFALTSVGSAKCLLNWIESMKHWTTARCSWLSARQASSNQPRALSLTLLVVRERSTWDRRNPRTHPRSQNAIWEKRGWPCLPCSARDAHRERLLQLRGLRCGRSRLNRLLHEKVSTRSQIQDWLRKQQAQARRTQRKGHIGKVTSLFAAEIARHAIDRCCGNEDIRDKVLSRPIPSQVGSAVRKRGPAPPQKRELLSTTETGMELPLAPWFGSLRRFWSVSGSSAMPYWPECPMMRGTQAISPVTTCLFVTV